MPKRPQIFILQGFPSTVRAGVNNGFWDTSRSLSKRSRLTLGRPYGHRVKTTGRSAINEHVSNGTVTGNDVVDSSTIGGSGKHHNRPLTTDGLTKANLICRVLQSGKAQSQPRAGSGLNGRRCD